MIRSTLPARRNRRSRQDRAATGGMGLLALLAIVLALGASGCGKGTYLVVHFTGDSGLPAVYGIRVTLTLSPDSGPTVQSSDTLPTADNTTTIQFPTSAAFKLNSASGTLDISANALDLQRAPVASAATSTPIRHAQTWDVTLAFASTQALSVPPAASGVDTSLVSEPELERQGRDPTWNGPIP
jgi:hypothetical protein